jgi:protein-S-isoprenylcysteine O-methyltransferase Ste14
MALSTRGKILYGATFLVALPLALAGWATATEGIVHLPAVTSLPLGGILDSTGALLMLWGMRDLWIHGGGLPMNADPPRRLVERGAYWLLPHPIYTGFCLLSAGASITLGSASGLWLVSPMVMLGCAALVLGYEDHDLRKRFGRGAMSFPAEDDGLHPTAIDRWRCYLFAVLPWAAIFGIVHFMGRPVDWASVFILTGKGPLLMDWANRVPLSAYLGFALVPLVARSGRDLRNTAIASLLTMGFAFAVFLATPLILTPHLVAAHEELWLWAGAWPGSYGEWVYFPSLPVMFSLVVAQALRRRWKWAGWIATAWVLLVVLCSVFAAQGGLVRTPGALISYALAANAAGLWGTIRWRGERIANSWREWRFGPVRVINHGAYVGAAGFFSIWIGGVLAGPGHLSAIVVAALVAVVGAALWAQYVEGSPQLLRPYGFYGGLLGGTLGALAAPLFHTSIWLLLGVFSATGSLVQAMGRLRCLVQGCCHGRPAPEGVGIRYGHPKSRVCRLSAWTGVPLHATPVYSILWNGLVTLLLWRLWAAHASLHLIAGLYFMLSGMGRFVEESFSGEPQTKVVAGLRLYQWSAIVSVVLGAAFSAFGSAEIAPDPSWRWDVALPAAGFGLLVWCAMGVDFPESQARFSRLT